MFFSIIGKIKRRFFVKLLKYEGKSDVFSKIIFERRRRRNYSARRKNDFTKKDIEVPPVRELPFLKIPLTEGF